MTWARSVAEKMGLNLTVMERGLSYSEMPRILQQFEFYIDLFSPQETSKTALEALSCGLKVVRWDETVLEELPSQHRPEVVVDRLADIYHKARE